MSYAKINLIAKITNSADFFGITSCSLTSRYTLTQDNDSKTKNRVYRISKVSTSICDISNVGEYMAGIARPTNTIACLLVITSDAATLSKISTSGCYFWLFLLIFAITTLFSIDCDNHRQSFWFSLRPFC